jgi:hypothetical protein
LDMFPNSFAKLRRPALCFMTVALKLVIRILRGPRPLIVSFLHSNQNGEFCFLQPFCTIKSKLLHKQPFDWPEVHVPTLEEMGIDPD